MNLYIKPKDKGVQVKLEMTYLGYIEFTDEGYKVNNDLHLDLQTALTTVIQSALPVITQRVVNEYVLIEQTLGRSISESLQEEVSSYP